jgi:hypothetical protein
MPLLAIGPSPWVLLMLQVGDIILPIDFYILIGYQFVGGMQWIYSAGY